ncbi:hypothetical protein SerAS12_4077 [Serratia sp. AS12]|uniref:hypothetical protein n=1 Tax=Serratia TaxID=613 RepID=UPI00020EA029|nr:MULTISPECIES: hypothetical protein [Serratia]AEF47175.1 hypothetical protein SerAS9_4076 [Serratia plymuthica AS9]AEF52127.1 hypothetical protein SerAS12_4077 [Serratia sp. AS12]AEG29834.1 hypothetical protein SerAS13_4077 [Serratia sp. AS13]UTN95861.1 hypothetical protein NLX81_20745 [Serratia plymuthica]
MDSTLLGALFGGGCAIAGAVATSTITYFANKKHDNLKILKQKKENLYLSIYELDLTINRYINLFEKEYIKENEIEEIDEIWWRTLSVIHMSINIYFPNLKSELSESLDVISLFFNNDIKKLREIQGMSPNYTIINLALQITAKRSYEKSKEAIRAFENKVIDMD